MATPAVDPSASIQSAAAGLKLNDLLRVLLTELTNQNPLKPVDNKDFLAQIAQFASLDTTQQLNQNVQQLLTLQAISQTVGLIGKTVSAITDTGATINGEVTALSLVTGVPRMDITTSDGAGSPVVHPGIAIGQLQTVRTRQ